MERSLALGEPGSVFAVTSLELARGHVVSFLSPFLGCHGDTIAGRGWVGTEGVGDADGKLGGGVARPQAPVRWPAGESLRLHAGSWGSGGGILVTLILEGTPPPHLLSTLNIKSHRPHG